MHAHEQAPLAVLTGSIQVQRITRLHGVAQLGHPRQVQCLKIGEETVTQIGNAAVGKRNPPFLVQLVADLFALLAAQIPGQSYMDNQIVSITLAGLDQTGEFIRAHDRMGSVVRTFFAYLLGIQHPGLECENLTPFAFLDLHRAGANWAFVGFRDKFDAGKSLTGLGRGPSNFCCRPTRTLRMPAQPVQ
ncbi:MAG: hypothetical protein DRQ47_07630 [Gammaproteobacteria bacterium]|nr:MAG: hypothetical protein DRQ47_07630 [Gammaproteobacteria bacterium]